MDEDERQEEFQRRRNEARTYAERMEIFRLELKDKHDRMAEYLSKKMVEEEGFSKWLNNAVNKQLASRPPPSKPYKISQAGKYK